MKHASVAFIISFTPSRFLNPTKERLARFNVAVPPQGFCRVKPAQPIDEASQTGGNVP
jgi:hypothetical protein